MIFGGVIVDCGADFLLCGEPQGPVWRTQASEEGIFDTSKNSLTALLGSFGCSFGVLVSWSLVASA